MLHDCLTNHFVTLSDYLPPACDNLTLLWLGQLGLREKIGDLLLLIVVGGDHCLS
jgi:hypothetical protein